MSDEDSSFGNDVSDDSSFEEAGPLEIKPKKSPWKVKPIAAKKSPSSVSTKTPVASWPKENGSATNQNEETKAQKSYGRTFRNDEAKPESTPKKRKRVAKKKLEDRDEYDIVVPSTFDTTFLVQISDNDLNLEGAVGAIGRMEADDTQGTPDLLFPQD